MQKREAHMQYPTYQATGWPIGSGNVESANKGVVEARRVWGRYALGSPQRQLDAGAAQCGLQSAVARDLGNVAGASTSAAHQSAAGREPTALDPCLVAPRLLGSAGLSAVPSTCCCCHLTGGGPRGATNSSSRLCLFLAQTVSQASSLHRWCYSRAVCKKMKHTQTKDGEPM